MKIVKAIELSLDDARRLVVDHIHDTLVGDPKYFKELIATEGFGDWYGPVDKMKPFDVADRVGELDLAARMAQQQGVEIVTVRLDSMNAVVVYDVSDPDCNGPDAVQTVQEAVA